MLTRKSRSINPASMTSGDAKLLYDMLTDMYNDDDVELFKAYQRYQYNQNEIFLTNDIAVIDNEDALFFLVLSSGDGNSEQVRLPDFANIKRVIGQLDIRVVNSLRREESLSFSPEMTDKVLLTANLDLLQLEEDELNFYARILTEITRNNAIKQFDAGKSFHFLWNEAGSIWLNLSLSHPLLPYPKADDSFGFEVLGSILGEGHFSEVKEGLGSIVPLGDGTYRLKPSGHVAKIADHVMSKPHRNAYHEYGLLTRAYHLHSKHPTVELTSSGQHISRRIECRMPGESLVDIIQGERDGIKALLTTDQRLQLTIALLRALQEQVHDNGLISRDIKPDNIMVDLETMTVKIIDFNLGKNKENIADRFAGGTLGYMAPEILKHGTSNESSDLFAMGMTIGYLWGLHASKVTTPERALAYAKLQSTRGLLADIDCNLNMRHSLNVLDAFKAMIHPESTKRLSAADAIGRFDQVRLERKLGQTPLIARSGVQDAHNHAISVRHSVNLAMHHHPKYSLIKHFDVLKLVNSITTPMLNFPDTSPAVREYIDTLGIKALDGLETRGAVFDKLDKIATDFKWQTEVLQFAKGFAGRSLRLDAAYEKAVNKLKRAQLRVDEITEAMVKIDAKLKDYIHPEMGKLMTKGRPEAAYNSSSSSMRWR